MKYEDIIDNNEEQTVAEEPAMACDITQLREAVVTRVSQSTDSDELYQCLTILDDSSMPCAISEEELDNEIELAMQSGNATQAEVNKVFSRWMH